MTEREFAELTGKDMQTEGFMDEYVAANAIYMASNNLSKQDFCKDYKKHGITTTVQTLADELERIRKGYENKCQEKCDMENKALRLISIAATMEDESCAEDIYNLAIELVGRKKAVIYSLENGYDLTDEDREFLLSFLI